MRWVLRSRAQTVAALLALAALLTMGFAPLFSGPGYEIALAAGLVLPGLAAVATALDSVRRRAQPFDAFSRGIASGCVMAFVGYATTLAHGARAGFCDPLSGTVHFFLGAGAGAVMGGAWGALAGGLVLALRGLRFPRALAVLFALAGPVLGVLLSAWRFYSSPTIFSYDPFFGYFSGTLYDTVVEAIPGLLTYRLGSGLTLIAAAIFAAHLVYEDGVLALRSLRRPGIPLIGALAATASLMLVLEGWRLGHWQTSATIERDLGARVSGARCDVIYARVIRADEARLFARDCDAQIPGLERYFEVGDTGRVTAYLFRSSADKKRLMGAGDTFIAKPWRREVYLQTSGYPHPVLGHELAHVVTGWFAPGPLHVAGSWGGIRANPGLIEGIAVAAAPDEDALTPTEWSRAMLDLKLLPGIAGLFSFDFLGENASKSYTVAGAFVRFVHDKFGAAALRGWYGGAPLPVLTGSSWAELEARWRAELTQVRVPDAALAVARARFERPAIWGRKCPHTIDLYRKDAERAQDRGDLVQARRTYEDLLRLDPHDDGARLALAACLLRRGEKEEARQLLNELATDDASSRLVQNRAVGMLADIDLESGDVDRAGQKYASLAARTLDEDALRTIEVKLSSLGDARARRAITAYLVGAPERGVDPMTAGAQLGAWLAEDPSDGLPEYLLGKDLVNRGMYGEAADRLDRALAKRLPPGRVLREALRQRVIVACALADSAGARKAYDIWSDKGGEPFTARRDALRRLVGRCTADGR